MGPEIESSRDEPAQSTASDQVLSSSGRLEEVERRLARAYGRPPWRSHGSPLDELIATVLSQHTSDTNTARAYAALRSRFPSWVDVISAHTADVADAIRPGGLAELKAPRIQAVLRLVAAETGQTSLDWLRSWSLDEARAWLVALPGVGPKTAACVLLFSLGLPAMPVDTHVHRVSRRLGLIEHDLTAEAAHAALDQLISSNRDATYALHLNLIQHGPFDMQVPRSRVPPLRTGRSLSQRQTGRNHSPALTATRTLALSQCAGLPDDEVSLKRGREEARAHEVDDSGR